MHAWQPMQRVISPVRPARAFAGRSGSVISARVMPRASAAPDATIASASFTSTTRDVAINGRPTRNGSACGTIAPSDKGGGGTISVEPRYDGDSPSAMLRVVDLVPQERSHAPRRLRVGGQAHADAEAGGRIADGSDDGEQEAARLGPLVVTPVQLGVEELGDRGSGVLPRSRRRRAHLRPRVGLQRRNPRRSPRSRAHAVLAASRGSAGSESPTARARAHAVGPRSARGRRGAAGRRAASHVGCTASPTRRYASTISGR